MRTSPSPITNNAAMRITFGSLNPASASWSVMTPLNGSTTSTSNATTSKRGLFATNNPTHTASSDNTKISSAFITGRITGRPSFPRGSAPVIPR